MHKAKFHTISKYLPTQGTVLVYSQGEYSVVRHKPSAYSAESKWPCTGPMQEPHRRGSEHSKLGGEGDPICLEGTG